MSSLQMRLSVRWAKYLKIDAVPMMWVDHTRAENIVATEHDVNESNIAFRQR